MDLEYKIYHQNVNVDDSEKDNFIALSEYSTRDVKWDTKKRNAVSMQAVFRRSENPNVRKYSNRTADCANGLEFGYVVDKETGELKLKLLTANFCHCRHCPVCDWRRSLRAQAMFKNALPEIIEKNPSSRWIFLTLTVENCHITELRETITEMNRAFMRMLKRKPFTFVKGWIKKVEVTQEKKRSDYAHPHFHVLLMVNESYFTSRDYLSKMDWVRYWSKAMRSEVALSVDVRALRKKFDSNDFATVELLKTFNYSVKTNDIVENDFTQKWFLEYIEQVHALKFLTSGLELKNIFKNQKEENESDDDLINVDENGDPVLTENDNPSLYFFYKYTAKKYVKNRD